MIELPNRIPQDPAVDTITVELSDKDWRHAGAVRAALEDESRSNPSLSGTEIRVVRGDYTCVDGPELIGSVLLSIAHRACMPKE